MDRLTLIKELINQGRKNYLEIGVENGHVFFRVKSTQKVAVDPEFKFDTVRKIGKIFSNPKNIFNKYYPQTSDDFFRLHGDNLYKNNKLDLALVDGMHEYHYALRDAENVLKYLNNDGVIIMHDCNPATAIAGGTFEEWLKNNEQDNWNGDVWKAIIHLRSLRKDINVFVADCDYGLGIITKQSPENTLNFTEAEIQSFTYDDLDKSRKEWLNLKPAAYLREYFKF
ncbi:MAG: class I SAM-dependent methyltransferase [Ginsengibacter sp.]